MIEDKLSHDERLRLECIAQAVAMRAPFISACPPPEEVVNIAKVFEQYVGQVLVWAGPVDDLLGDGYPMGWAYPLPEGTMVSVSVIQSEPTPTDPEDFQSPGSKGP